MERKKTSLLILGVCALILSVIGVTYAFWQLRLQQTDENNLTSSCFDVELIDEKDAIQLKKAYPILDEEGEKLTPYTFTLTNKCNANVKYQINLESLNEVDNVSIETNRLQSKYIKEKLNEEGKTGSINILTDNPTVETTLEEAVESYKLTTGYMTADDKTKTFELRLWLDGDLTMEDEEAMNKTFASKITIVATYAKETKKTLEETILALPIENKDDENPGTTGLYKVTHEDANITYTSNPLYIERLKKTELRYAGSDPNNYVSFGDKYENDKFTLILCVYGDCNNVGSNPSLGVPESFSSQTDCDSKKEEIQQMLDGELGEVEIEYELKCQQTQKKGGLISDWRIIGLVNTPEGQRIKLIRNGSIGEFSWDASAFNINEGHGVNEWSQSDLMKLLNPGYENNLLENKSGEVQTGEYVNDSLYWNGGNGQCYNGPQNSASSCSFTNTKIPDTLKKMIEVVTWNTGSNEIEFDFANINVKNFYQIERSSNTGDICKSGSGSSSCNDEVERTTSWKGKVGLVYSSDYGYATSGGTASNRTSCFETPTYDWGQYSEYKDCESNDWLFTSYVYWTLSPRRDSFYASGMFYLHGGASGDFSNATLASGSIGVRPSVYLKPDVLVSLGDGQKDSPYVLEY